jgi:hypothetical protein
VVSKTSIMIGNNVESCVQQLIEHDFIRNWQRLAPEHANTARILIVAFGNELAYENALDEVIAFASRHGAIWRHDDYPRYGDPREKEWMAPM